MEKLQLSCQKSHEYPLNLVFAPDAVYDLNGKRELLQRLAPYTFAQESRASLFFWELEKHRFQRAYVSNREELRDHLNRTVNSAQESPLCRYVFIQAPSSQSRLLLTLDMMTDILTFFQVMPGVVPMLASFGLDADKDFQYCRFESNTTLHVSERLLEVPELRRSGHVLELAYTFRAIEPSSSLPSMPWQIKQTCVYHSFDMLTGSTTWIVVKGSDIVKKRIVEDSRLNDAQLDQNQSPSQAFCASLETQLVFLDLSTEFWRDYTNDLESRVQEATRTMAFQPIVSPNAAILAPTVQMDDQVAAMTLWDRARTFTTSQLSRRSTRQTFATRNDKTEPAPSSGANTFALSDLPEVLPEPRTVDEVRSREEAYFDLLQQINGLEERAYKAHLVLRTTKKVWKQLQKTYLELENDTLFPTLLGNQYRRQLRRFHHRIESTQDALEIHVFRVESLLAILSGRKTMLHNILEWYSMRSSNDVAVQGTQSALKMEDMTLHMQEIANRTEKETVSMRSITLVTMFFLPGTFISTLMSTDIVKFPDNQKQYSSSALRLFLLVSFPMIAATFCAWYVVYWCANSREKLQRARRRISSV